MLLVLKHGCGLRSVRLLASAHSVSSTDQFLSFNRLSSRRSRLSGAPALRARRRSRQSSHLASFDLFRRWRRGQICVKFAGFGLRQVFVGESPDHHALSPAERPEHDDLVADLDVAVGLGRLPVDVNLTVLTGVLRFRSGLETDRRCRARDRASSLVRGSWFVVRGSGFVGFGVRGSGFGVRGSGFGVRGSGFGVRGSGFGVRGSGFGVRGSGVTWVRYGSGFGVQGSAFAVSVYARSSWRSTHPTRACQSRLSHRRR